MGRNDAQRWYDQNVNDPSESYITPADAKASIAQTYADMAGAVRVGDGTNGVLGHLYTPNPIYNDVDAAAFVGLAPAGWIDQGPLGGSGGGDGSGATDHGDLTGLDEDDHPQYQARAEKGVASGYAALDATGKVPSDQLPTLVSTPSRYVPVIIFNGESNSGGYAENVHATPQELIARPSIQIFDNVNLASFQDLDIGTNNLLGHSGLSNGATHGWELGLANAVEAGQFWDSTVYLIKTGQGGSSISQWAEGSGFWTTFLARTRAALDILRSQGKVPLIYVWYSLGINDAISGTNEAAWLDDVKELHSRMRSELGFVPIFMTTFMTSSPGVNYNDSIEAYAASDNMLYAVNGSDAGIRDANHWNYTGMKLVASRFVEATQAFGQHEGYISRQISALSGAASAVVVSKPQIIRTPATVSFKEGTSGSFTVALSGAPAANVTVAVGATGGNVTPSPPSLTFTTSNWSNAQTVTLTSPDDGGENGPRSATVNLTSSGVSAPASVAVTVTDASASVPDITPLPWQDFSNTTSDGSNQLHVVATGGATGANSTVALSTAEPFTLITDWFSGTDASAMVTMLEDTLYLNFTWANQTAFVSGVYTNGGATYAATSYTTNIPISGWTPTFPCKVKIASSGNDIIYSSSEDDGASWTVRYTHAGRLSGVSVVYPRILWAVPSVGQKGRLSIEGEFSSAPINTAAPAITGTATEGSTLTCSAGTWSGSPTQYDYQWKREGTPLGSAINSTYQIVTADLGSTLTCTVTATNADGSTSVTAAGMYIPSGGGPVAQPVTWSNFLNADAPGVPGRVRCLGAGTTGAVAVETLDLTQAWSVEIEHVSGTLTDGVVVYIDDEPSASFTWNSANTFVVGSYQYGNEHQSATAGNQATSTGQTLTYPTRIKMSKSGNDVVFQRADGAGAYGSVFHTRSGVLAGKTTGYIKALFAVPSNGQYITVTKIQ